MIVGDPGAPWTVADARAVGRAAWVHRGGLRAPTSPPTCSRCLPAIRLALDGQALVRRAEAGPLVLDDDFDPEVLRHLTALKLNEEELEALGGEERVLELGVPELLLTQASAGAIVIARGVREHVHADRSKSTIRPGRRCVPRGLRLGARIRPQAALRSSPGSDNRGPRARNRARTRARASNRVTAWVRTVEGVFEVDVEAEAVLGEVEIEVDHGRLDVNLPRLVAASAGGSTVVALVTRRPPLLVRGMPERPGTSPAPACRRVRRRGRLRSAGPRPLCGAQPAVPLARRRPLLALARARAARHRSRRLVYGSLNSPRATVTAEPPTSTDSIVSRSRPRAHRASRVARSRCPARSRSPHPRG